MLNSNCWHKWGKWVEEKSFVAKDTWEDTHFVLIQSRVCSRCNYKEIKKQDLVTD